MSNKPRILVQLDPDSQPSVFDSVVAVDAGVDHLFRHQSVTLDEITNLVHGAMFTRGPKDLQHTAIFIGGSDVSTAEKMLKKVTDTFFGPVRVSVMMDASGANTTAAAAVVTAAQHLDLSQTRALVLAATGPVGQRVARLLARAGAQVKLASRSMDRAQSLADQLKESIPSPNQLIPVTTNSQSEIKSAVAETDLVIAAGAAGIELLDVESRIASEVKVAIDLNAVPPVGLAGVEVTDKGVEKEGQFVYGAIGVGGTKMQIHKAAIRMLFEANDKVMDVDEIYQLGLTFT